MTHPHLREIPVTSQRFDEIPQTLRSTSSNRFYYSRSFFETNFLPFSRLEESRLSLIFHARRPIIILHRLIRGVLARVLARVTGLAAELGVGVPLPRRFLPASRLSRVRSRDPRTWQRGNFDLDVASSATEPLSGQAPWNGASCHTDSPHRVSSLMRNYREFLLCNQSFNTMIGYTWIHFFFFFFFFSPVFYVLGWNFGQCGNSLSVERILR